MIKKLVCILLVLSLLCACQPAGPGGEENQREALNGKTARAGEADETAPSAQSSSGAPSGAPQGGEGLAGLWIGADA